MCNLYSITTNQDAVRRLFGVAIDSAGILPSLASALPSRRRRLFATGAAVANW
jgi:hypothetical protein